MAFRSRRRGPGRGRFGPTDYAKPEPFVIFPEITLLAPKLITKDTDLVVTHYKYESFWRNSPYHLGDGVLKPENESLDIERFSDSLKPKSKSNKRGAFYDYLLLRPDNFPRDLLGGTRRERPLKKAKWSLDAELDMLEKLEEKFEAEGKDKKGGEKDDKPKKEEEDDEEEEEEEPEKDEEEESDNEDYYPNPFDDDDDDYNQATDDDDQTLL